jgi:uncharacterized protein DUF1569
MPSPAPVKWKRQPRMKTLLNARDRTEVRDRLARVRPDAQRRWGRMSAHQMICHLGDSMRVALGEKYVSPANSPFMRIILKPLALWVPVPWAHDFKTRPEIDQQQGGTPPANFASDVKELHILFDRFCACEECAPHAMFGQMSRTERMRHGYLHFDHHLRQFGV